MRRLRSGQRRQRVRIPGPSPRPRPNPVLSVAQANSGAGSGAGSGSTADPGGKEAFPREYHLGMRRSLVLLAAVVFAFTLSAEVELPKADEKWITFETDGFRFISSASPRVTQGIARDLLRMRAAVGQLTRLRVYTAEPTRVCIFSSERGFAPYRDAAVGVEDSNFATSSAAARASTKRSPARSGCR